MHPELLRYRLTNFQSWKHVPSGLWDLVELKQTSSRDQMGRRKQPDGLDLPTVAKALAAVKPHAGFSKDNLGKLVGWDWTVDAPASIF